jgi:hypothetical protein
MGLLFVVSCGGSDDNASLTTPNLTLSNYTSKVEVGTDARIDFGYSDPEGDIATFFVTEKFGTKIVPQQFPAKDLLISGSQGSSYLTIAYPTSTSIGQHSYEIWVTDSQGNISNVLSLTITVSAATDVPSIMLLNYPSTVKVGQDARIDFWFSDSGGDISDFYISEVYAGVLAPIYSVFPARSLSIIGKSGSAYITRSGKTDDQVGKHDFMIWVNDSNGNISNNVTFTITYN